jgi:hypothetical protein
MMMIPLSQARIKPKSEDFYIAGYWEGYAIWKGGLWFLYHEIGYHLEEHLQ